MVYPILPVHQAQQDLTEQLELPGLLILPVLQVQMDQLVLQVPQVLQDRLKLPVHQAHLVALALQV